MKNFLNGLFLGGLLALLFAPKKGDDLREDIKQYVNETRSKAEHRAHVYEDIAKETSQNIKQATTEAADSIRIQLNETIDSARRDINKARQEVEADLVEAKDSVKLDDNHHEIDDEGIHLSQTN